MSASHQVSFIRGIAERILGSCVVVRRLPAFSGGGRIVVSSRVGGLKYLFKPTDRLDPELLRIASLLVTKGASVWDVGANVGLFSRAAAHHAGSEGHVVAIEADTDAVSLLFRTARYVSTALTVLPIAVSDQDGFVQFNIARRARAANSVKGFGSSQTGGVREVRMLPSYKLDTLLGHLQPPTMIKIDVEGAEVLVLRGAKKILSEYRPAIYCEVRNDTRDEVTSVLEGYGYKAFDGDSFGSAVSQPVTSATNNLVAIHYD